MSNASLFFFSKIVNISILYGNEFADMKSRATTTAESYLSSSFQLSRMSLRMLYVLFIIKKAGSEGFEPPVPVGTPIFKAGAFVHSANYPLRLI